VTPQKETPVKQQRPEPQIEARLEILEDDDNPVRGTVKLTAAEIAEREAEKAGLAFELKSRIAARDSVLGNVQGDEDIEHLDPRARRAGSRREPAVIAEPSVPQPAITLPSSRAVETATEAVEQANAELAAMEEERRAVERDWAAKQRAEEDAHQAKLNELRTKRNAAEAEVKKQRLAHAAVELKAQIEAAERERALDRRRQAAALEEKNAQLTARVKPVVDRAKATYAALQEIEREHGAHLQQLASVSWDQTPSTWPGAVRAAYNNEIHDPAIKFRHELHLMVTGLASNIHNAIALLSRGWSADASFPQQVNEAIRLLSYSDEYVRVAEDGLADLHRRLEDIFERANFNPRTTPDVVEIMPRPLRDAAMAEAHARMAERGQQTRAER
jgi:hypothetical protein